MDDFNFDFPNDMFNGREIDENFWRTSVHPEDKSPKPTFCLSIEAIQDIAMKKFQMKGCGPEMNDIDLQEWIDVYENDIKDLNFDQIVKKYDVKFYEATGGLCLLTICY